MAALSATGMAALLVASKLDDVMTKIGPTNPLSGQGKRSLSFSEASVQGEDDKESQYSRGSSWSVKNTFVHVDPEGFSDCDDEDLCLPTKSKSAPNIASKPVQRPLMLPLSSRHRSSAAPSEHGDSSAPAHILALPSPCRSVLDDDHDSCLFPPGLVAAARTPRVRFDLTPKVCGEAEEAIVFQPVFGEIQEDTDKQAEKRASTSPEATTLLELPHKLPDSWTSCSARVKNTFVHVETDAADQVEDDLPTRSISVPYLQSTENSAGLLSPVASDLRRHSSAPASSPTHDTSVPISTVSLEIWQNSLDLTTAPRASVGSVLHGTGRCKPCAWFWKPQSCRWGVECGHCHECPEGELRRRKKEKIAGLKMEKQPQEESLPLP